MNTKRTACLFYCLFTMAFASSFASEGPAPVLNPMTYVSASGVYSLSVDPTDLYGRGPADYRFTKDGKTVWANRLPYTLWNATVIDSGQVAGYAYTHGWRGFSEGDLDTGPGEFIVAMFSAEGKTLNEEKHTREWSNSPDTPPTLRAVGTIYDASGKRFVIRVVDPDVNRHIEQWWIFDQESGKRIDIFEPGRSMPDEKDDESRFILSAQAVPDTPLVLTHRWKYDSGNCGGVFTLVDLNDAKLKPVWSLSLDGDYSIPDNEKTEDLIQDKIRSEGAILNCNKSSSFAILAVKQQKKIAFSVEKSGDGTWRIRETARTPHEFPTNNPVPESHKFPKIELAEVAVVRLSGTGTRKESPISDLQEFGFDAEGKICVLTVPKNADPHLLYITQQGEVLKDLRLPVGKLQEFVEYSNPANVGGSKFVVAVSDRMEDGKARCFIADFATETVNEVPGFSCPAVKVLAGFPDGRFAALTSHRMKYTDDYGLSLFDAQGKPIWQKEESGFTGKPEEFLGPKDITRYGDDSIAVLDNIRRSIQFFDMKGVFLRSIDLDETWQREPNYPTHILEDSKDRLAVYDFNAKFTLVRMNAKGQIQSQCNPKFPDGRPVKVNQGLRRSPEGRLWTADGFVLLRLSDNGTVDRILGEQVVSDTIYRPGLVAVDLQDRVYMADYRTNTVHVFDGDGKKKGVCVPDAKDLTETSYVQRITTSADGNVFVSLGLDDDNDYVRFDKELKRVERVRIDLNSVSQDWYFQPTGQLCWVSGYEDVFLVKDLRNVVRKISRRADKQWLVHPASIGVAQDGSAAVVATSRSGEVSVNTYSPTGDPRASYVGPQEWKSYGEVAYDGQSAFFRNGNDVYIIDSNNRCIGFFPLPFGIAEKNPWTGPFLAAQGKQLWFVNLERLSLHKFAIPK